MNSMPLFPSSQKPRPRLPARPPLPPFRPIPRCPSVVAKLLARTLAGLTPDQHADFEERVAICIHDGGLPEAEAVRVAAADVASHEQSQEHTR